MSINRLKTELRQKRIEIENARNNKINWEVKRKELLAQMVHVDSKIEEYFHKERVAVQEANELYTQLQSKRKENEIRTDRVE